LILVGLFCNAIYCAVKIHRDFQSGHAAFGVVGLIGVVGSTGIAATAIAAIILISEGQLT